MLTALLMLEVMGGGVEVGTGPIIAPPASTAAALSVPVDSPVGTDVPLGAYSWPRPLDPSDRAPYAFDFSQLLGSAERIADIVRLTMSAAGAAVGVEIDTSAGRTPIIGTEGKAVQIWFRVAEASQDDPAFTGPGVRVGVSILVETDAVPFKRFERTAVLTVREQ